MKPAYLLIFVFFTCILVSCKKDEPQPEPAESPELIFKFKFDSDQERLNNLGEESSVLEGNAAQSPEFNFISAHYIELIEDQWTPVGGGLVLYDGDETNNGGADAIDFNLSPVVIEDEVFLSVPFTESLAGSYEYLRVSLSYQNYDISFLSSFGQLEGTLASFIGFNTYITEFTVNEEVVSVFENKAQGYWAFETIGQIIEGQAPEGATTVPNPLFASSPIPTGSCLVTGQFESPLTLTGNETENIVITMSLSTNNSFEWEEVNEDGMFEPEAGENVVDMGIRGLIPIVN